MFLLTFLTLIVSQNDLRLFENTLSRIFLKILKHLNFEILENFFQASL